jgi:hypothetical protein
MKENSLAQRNKINNIEIFLKFTKSADVLSDILKILILQDYLWLW